MIVVDDQVVYPTMYRPSTFVDFENTKAWRRALALLGALLAVLGLTVALDAGDASAVVGVALFFATAVAAGADRLEWATALGVAGVVWTTVGISLVLGTISFRTAAAVSLAVVGAVAIAVSVFRAFRSRDPAKRISASDR